MGQAAGEAGQVGQLGAGVRGPAERAAHRGLGTLDASRRGRGRERVGPRTVGEAVRGGASSGAGPHLHLVGRAELKALVGVGTGRGGRVPDVGAVGQVGAVLFAEWEEPVLIGGSASMGEAWVGVAGNGILDWGVDLELRGDEAAGTGAQSRGTGPRPSS